jgi:hypothetical protein
MKPYFTRHANVDDPEFTAVRIENEYEEWLAKAFESSMYLGPAFQYEALKAAAEKTIHAHVGEDEEPAPRERRRVRRLVTAMLRACNALVTRTFRRGLPTPTPPVVAVAMPAAVPSPLAPAELADVVIPTAPVAPPAMTAPVSATRPPVAGGALQARL